MLARDILLIEIAPAAVPGDPYHILPPPWPPILVSGSPLPIGVTSAVPKGQAFTLQMGVANALGAATWSASGLPAGASIDPATGLISGAGTTQGDNYATITADDTANGGTVTTTVIRLQIGAAFSLVGSLKQATRGAAYQANVIPIGATGTLTWSATGLPSGLAISSTTGLIAGSTFVIGTASVTISAADSGTGTTASITMPLVVNRVISLIALDGSPSVVPKILAGSAFATVATACNSVSTVPGGTQPIVWTASNLPVGIDIDEQSGIIGGQTTADAVGSYVVPVTATGVWGETFTRNVTFVVMSGIKSIAVGSFAVGNAADGVGSLDLLSLIIGDGGDGAFVFDGTNTYPGIASLSGSTYTLQRSIFATNVTVANGISVNESGCIIYWTGRLDIGNASANAIHNNGNAGTSAVGQSGGIATSVKPANDCGAGGGGANATNGTTTNSSIPSTVNALQACAGGLGGAAGKGGNGSGGSGANGGPGQAADNAIGIAIRSILHGLAFGNGTLAGGTAGGPGAGGGGNNTQPGGGGGGPGNGAGPVILIGNELFTTASTAAGAIASIGGNGGNGAAGTASGCGGGSGGGGGAGGYVLIMIKTRTGPVIAGLIKLDGGTAGTGGASGGGAGVAGADGKGGSFGGYSIFNMLLPSTVGGLGSHNPAPTRVGLTLSVSF